MNLDSKTMAEHRRCLVTRRKAFGEKLAHLTFPIAWTLMQSDLRHSAPPMTMVSAVPVVEPVPYCWDGGAA